MVRTRFVVVAWSVALFTPAVVSAQTAVLSGTVRTETHSPVRGAFVTITPLNLSTVTNDQGLYRLTIPAAQASGEVSLIVTSIGYRRSETRVQLRPGALTQNVTVVEQAISLDQVVVTGTAGRQERRAQPATISTIDADRVADVAPVQSVANLLQARSPGVMLRSISGTSGTGQVINIRGQASIGLSNSPLIFIDGILSDGGNMQEFGVGGAQGSRLNDLKLEDIESIEVVKGPAAATLYGSDASAGVINIVTKRGRIQSGFTQSITLEYGQANPNFRPPDNYAKCEDDNLEEAACQNVPEGTVLIDNPLLRTNAFGDGRYRNLMWSLRGGGQNYGVFLSLGADQEEGTLDNNEYGRISSRASFDFVPGPKWRMETGFSLGRTTTRLPNNDNNIYGWLGGGLLGNPATVGGTNDGWYAPFRNERAIVSLENFDKAMRFQPRASVQYTPFEWFSHRLTAGADIIRTRAFSLFPKNDNSWFDSEVLNSGQIQELRRSEDRYTIDYLGNVTWHASTAVRTDLSFGSQVIIHTNDQATATGQDLVNNDVRDVATAAIRTGTQSYDQDRRIGFFGQANVSLNEKLYLQAGLRFDQASVFGANSDAFVSPKVGLAYVISDEPFLRNLLSENALTTLRLRGAYGATGRQPTTGVLTTYDPAPLAISTEEVQNGVTAENPGNPNLRPERSAELELGFDAGFLNDRLGLEVTYFNKRTTDLVLEQELPGSLGFGDDRSVNIGEVVNRGLEVAANARVLTRDNLSLELFATVNTLHNEIVDQGGVPAGTGTARDTAGYPINSVWEYVIKRIENDTVIISNQREFLGNPQNLPGWEGTFSTTLTLFRDFSLYAGLDARGDYIVNDGTAEFRDRQLPSSAYAILRADGFPPEDVLSRFGPFRTEDGRTIARGEVDTAYRMKGDFLRLREVAASYRLPASFAQRFVRAQSAQLTFAMRNVNMWTDYTGLDPETGQFLTVPQDRRWTLRMNVTF